MAYDAEIRVGTKVDTSQMQKLQLKIDDTTDEVSQLSKRLDELKNKQVPTKEYEELQVILEGAKYRAEQLAEAIEKTPEPDAGEELKKLAQQEEKVYKQMQLINLELSKPIPERKAGLYEELQEAKNELYVLKNAEQALKNGNSYADSMVKEYEEAQKAVEAVEKELEALKEAGKAFSLDINTEKIAETEKELSRAQAELRALTTQQNELIAKQLNKGGGFKKLTDSAKKAFTSLYSGAKSTFEKVGNAAKKAFGRINKDAEKTNGLLATMRSRMQGLALGLLIFNQITKAFHAMVSGAKEGITEFAKYSKDCNAVLSEFKSSLQTVKYSLGAAFAPIIQVVVPYITLFVNILNDAITKLSQFFAVLTGSSTYYKAIKQQVDFAGSLEDTANAAKEAAGALAGFDKLTVIKQPDDSGSNGTGAGAGTGGGFEEVPVENGIKELAQKVKEIFASLFAPMKEAWNREGQFVIDSWKSALDEIRKLVKDIGRDFLIVWNQEETINVLEDILRIVGDIGLVAANLARNFREAWNENDTGLHIFENIRDIFAVIVANIRAAADYTVKWAENVNFVPLLTKIEQWTESLNTVFDNLSGIVTDFYTQVLLPLAKWTIEKGLPDLLQVFIDFNNEVDWEALREKLSEFWEHLEPFAETVGEGLIQFIGDLSQKIADFTKSETFEKLLNRLEEKMDGTTPDDIASGIEKIAKAILFFKGVALGLNVLATLAPAVSTVKSLVDIFKGGKAATVAGEMDTMTESLGGLQSGLSGFLFTAGATAAFFDFFKHHEEVKKSSEQFENFTSSAKELDEQLKNGEITYGEYQKSAENLRGELEEFSKSQFRIPGIEYDENGWNKSLIALKDKITGWWDNVIGDAALAGVSAGTALAEGLQSSTAAMGASIAALGVQMATKAPEMSKQTNALGTAAVAGFNMGISQNETKTDATVQTWMSGVEKSMHDSAMKYGSPSKTAEGFGLNTVLGYNNGISKNVSKTVSVIKSYMQTIQNTFRQIVTMLSDIGEQAIGAFIEGLASKQSELKKTVEDITKTMEKAVTAASKVKMSSYSSTTTSSIPQLATGAVIRGGNPFVAVLGDQPAGQTNIEAPLSTIKKALKEVMRENGGMGGEYTFVAQLNGKTLYKETVRQDQLFRKSTGKSRLGK